MSLLSPSTFPYPIPGKFGQEMSAVAGLLRKRQPGGGVLVIRPIRSPALGIPAVAGEAWFRAAFALCWLA